MFNHKIILKNKKLKFVQSQIKINKNQAVIRVKSCGICGSDLKILRYGSKRVKDNTVLGHEVAGQILSFKKNTIIRKNIILGADIPSKKFKDFAIGHEIDGGFQKFLILDKGILKKIPHVVTKKKINYNIASLCEPLACCLNGIEKVKFKKNRNVIIYGAGPIGYLLATLLIYYNAKKVFIVDNNLGRLKIGPIYKNLYKLNLKSYEKKLKEILKPNEKIDYGFVACNSPKAQQDVLKIVNNGGVVNFFSGIKQGKNKIGVNIDTNLIHYKELSVVGSHGSKKKHLIKAANLIINNKIKLKKIITNIYNIRKYDSAFGKSKNASCLKVVIKP